jgi:hypothetical protein
MNQIATKMSHIYLNTFSPIFARFLATMGKSLLTIGPIEAGRALACVIAVRTVQASASILAWLM